jgi:hypothetical protein
MTFDEYMRSLGYGPKETSQMNQNKRHTLREQYWATGGSGGGTATPAPSPYTAPATTPTEPPIGHTPADTTQNWINENPYEYMQGKLQGSGLMSPTGGTSFDTWLTNSYLPRVMGSYYQEMSKNAAGNLDGTTGTAGIAPVKSSIDPAQARRMFLHRPDAERMPNPFAAGPGRWSMWD